MNGYRAIAFKTGGKLHLRSRNDNDFTKRYRGILKGLARLPDETVIDGEVVAFDADGRPSFSSLQNFASAERRQSSTTSSTSSCAPAATCAGTLGVTHGVSEYRCGTCRHTWVWLR